MTFFYDKDKWNFFCERDSGTTFFKNFCNDNCEKCIDKFEKFSGFIHKNNAIRVKAGTVLVLIQESPCIQDV